MPEPLTGRSSGKGAVALAVLLSGSLLITDPAPAQTVPPAARGQAAINAGLASALHIGTITVPYESFEAPAGTAAGEAPSFAPLDTGQPTSVVGRHYIEQATPPSQSYDQLIAQAPSVQDIQPNGPVAQQNYGESIRGFQYNQFNTAFDGIVLPGTPSSFAPQSAVYFTDHDIGSVTVDRGPGTASTIGYATFGGTVSIASKTPSQRFEINPYGAIGSFRSGLGGLDLETGTQASLNGGRGFIDLSAAGSGAWLTGTTTERRNAFLKWQQPVGENTVITAAAILNRSYGHTPYGAQLGQIEAYGPRYALNGNPRSQAFQGFNTDYYDTDFEYIRADTSLASGLDLSDTAYTASYYHHGSQGADPNGTTPNLDGAIYIGGARVTAAGDVPGSEGHNDFRDWGDILRLRQQAGFGSLEAGFWFDYVSNSSYRYTIDLSRGSVAYTKKRGASPFSYNYIDDLTTLQPYLQANLDAAPWLTLIPGLRFTAVTRKLDAAINRGTKLPARDSETFSAAQPSLEAKFKLGPDWTAYAQIAKGFLAPPLSVFATTDVTAVSPETTTNYQVGTAFRTSRLSLGADLYDIPFNNYIASSTVAGTTLYTNQGGATFRGIEAELSYKLLGPLFIFANGSLNDATYDNGATVAQSPRRTGALGATFDQRGVFTEGDELFGSITGKYIGPQYGSDAGKTDAFPIKSYNAINLGSAYTLAFAEHQIRFGLDVFNLANRHAIQALAGLAGNGTTPLYWTQPGRSIVVSISASLPG